MAFQAHRRDFERARPPAGATTVSSGDLLQMDDHDVRSWATGLPERSWAERTPAGGGVGCPPSGSVPQGQV